MPYPDSTRSALLALCEALVGAVTRAQAAITAGHHDIATAQTAVATELLDTLITDLEAAGEDPGTLDEDAVNPRDA